MTGRRRKSRSNFKLCSIQPCHSNVLSALIFLSWSQLLFPKANATTFSCPEGVLGSMDFKLRKFYGFSSMGPVTYANAEAACVADGLQLATTVSLALDAQGAALFAAGRSEGGWLSLENPLQGECNSTASCSGVLAASGGGSPVLSMFGFGFNVTNSSSCVALDPGGYVVSVACNSTHQAICDSGEFCHSYYIAENQPEPSWFGLGESFYLFDPLTVMDYDSAKQFCRNNSGGLLTFQSLAERSGLNFWFQMLSSKGDVFSSEAYTGVTYDQANNTMDLGFIPNWCNSSTPDPATTSPNTPILLNLTSRTDEQCWFAAVNLTATANYICEKRDDRCYEQGDNGMPSYTNFANVTTQTDCDDICLEDPRCLSTSFLYATNECFLKDKAEKMLTPSMDTVHQPKYCNPGCLENGISYPVEEYGEAVQYQEAHNSTIYSCKGHCMTNPHCVAGNYYYNGNTTTWDCQMLARTGDSYKDLRHGGIVVLRDCEIDYAFDANGWFSKGASSYHFDHNPNVGITPAQAEQQCQAMGARLVNFEEIEELTALRVYMLHLEWMGVTLQDRYIIGLNRENWTWTNGKSLHYQDWYQAQPDGDNLSQPIISLRRSEGSRFGDYAVGQENQGFICEKDNGICDPPGVLYTEFAYRYYYFEPSNYTWKTAKTFCESSDSQLASFYSEGEFNFVRDTVINGTTGPSSSIIWPGLIIVRPGDTSCNNAGCDGKLQWADGRFFVYQSWHGPVQIATSDYCVTFDTATGQLLGDGSFCDTKEMGFVCQTKCERVGCRVEHVLSRGSGERLQPGGDMR